MEIENIREENSEELSDKELRLLAEKFQLGGDIHVLTCVPVYGPFKDEENAPAVDPDDSPSVLVPVTQLTEDKDSIIQHEDDGFKYHPLPKGCIKLLLCRVCNFHCVDREMAKMHANMTRHQLQQMFRCDNCRALLTSLISFIDHRNNFCKKIKSKSRNTCQICFKVLSKPHSLRRHMEVVHGGKKCNECDQRFVKLSDLIEHYKVSHPDKLRSIPDDSKKTNTNPEHSKLDKVSNNKSETVDDSKRVIKEPKRMITESNEHICEICKKGFASAQNLSRHRFLSHLIAPTNDMPKPYNCDICGKSFTRGDHVKRHKMTVHANGRHKCSNCSAGFNKIEEFTTHVSFCCPNESFNNDVDITYDNI